MADRRPGADEGHAPVQGKGRRPQATVLAARLQRRWSLTAAREQGRLGCLLLLLAVIAGCVPFRPGESPAAATRTLTLTPTYLPTGSSSPGLETTEPTLGMVKSLVTQPPAPAPETVDTPAFLPSPTALPTARPPFDPATWETLPVLPEIGPRARAVIAEGLARGANPNAFSKVGDCESQTTWFLGDFDLGEKYYDLGPYAPELGPVIPFYAGSFERVSLAAKQGFTAASLLSPLWSDRKVCQKNESPLACEYRLHRPLVAFVMLGTNDAVNPKTFEGHMRKVIDFSLAQGVLPILGTKADNREGDHRINQTIARLAYEYDLPLWNFWLAVQDLPGNGLQEDGAHLTFAAPFFDNPAALKKAWPVRNLNALQILAMVMEASQK